MGLTVCFRKSKNLDQDDLTAIQKMADELEREDGLSRKDAVLRAIDLAIEQEIDDYQALYKQITDKGGKPPTPEELRNEYLPPSAASMADMSDDEFAALLEGATKPKAAPRKPRSSSGAGTTRKPRAAKAKTDQPTAKPENLGASLITAAAKHGVKGADEALKGLAELFGGKGKLSSGPTFDEETYAKARPHFKKALEEFIAAGKSLADFIQFIVDQFKGFGIDAKPYLYQFHKDVKGSIIKIRGIHEDAESTTDAPQEPGRDRTESEDSQSTESGRGRADGAARQPGEQTGEGRPEREGDTGVSTDRPDAGGEPGGLDLFADSPEFVERADGSADGRRGASSGGQGVSNQPGRRKSLASAIRQSEERSKLKPTTAEFIPADLDNIAATLPQLFPEQQEDVLFAEKRFHEADGRGVLLAHGTGAGKTHAALGVIKRHIMQGKGNIIITAPGRRVIKQWIDAGKTMGIDISKLSGKKDAGAGVVITSYANFRDNNEIMRREWDLVVHDESHKLSGNEAGENSLALDASRAITGHPRGMMRYAQALEADLLAQIESMQSAAKIHRNSDDERLWRQAEEEQAKADELVKEWRKRLEKHVANREALWQSKATRRLDLSATPFAYVKSVDLAEGFLFEYQTGDVRIGNSNQSGYEQFFVEHFGYRIRYHKLTEPGKEVDRGLMERQFNNWLKEQGALRSRRALIDHDYSREFVAVNDFIGRRIDDGIKYIRERAFDKDDPLSKAFSKIDDQLRERLDYHERIRLLEAIKAPHAVKRAKKHLAMGRKVVIFHSRIQGGSSNPFGFEPIKNPANESAENYNKAIEEFKSANPDLVDLAISAIRPLDLFAREFGDQMTTYNGRITDNEKDMNPEIFNRDDSHVRVIAVQDEGGQEGISLHDTTGKHPRVLMNIGLPVKPTQAMQIEGRTYRVGQQSNAIYEYFSTDTNFERWTFADKISGRIETADNLAMGDEARSLKDAFIDAYENASDSAPSLEQGIGGKESDAGNWGAITPFERAKTWYFGTARNSRRRGDREGVDYFATPEPLGFKMVEWAGIRPRESALEPSAGHGAIARFFPDMANNTFVEPADELLSKLALRAPGNHRNERFEDLHISNKYHAIVMNPPFGSGGSTAMEHLSKAMGHLKNGGRIVALIPEGPAADKKFDALMYGKGNELEQLKEKRKALRRDGKTTTTIDKRIDQLSNFHVVAEFGLPRVTFERAGTSVKARIVIIDRMDTLPEVWYRQPRIDLEGESINDFFDRLEDQDVPERSEIPMTPEEVIEGYGLKLKQIENGSFQLSGNTFNHRSTISPVARANDGWWNSIEKVWEFEKDPTAALVEAFESSGRNDAEDTAFIASGGQESEATTGERGDTGTGVAGSNSAPQTAFKLAQTRHAKKGIDLYVATITTRVERPEYNRINHIAKKHNGYYSKFRGNGAIPGFQFESDSDRKAFVDEVNGGGEVLANLRPPSRGIRSSEKNKPSMSALHNISTEGLLFADEMGGLAAPSIAVVTADNDPYGEGVGLEGFGEITLIGTKDLADPEKVDVFDADAYTSTFPIPEYRKVKSATAQTLVEEIRGWDEKYNGRRTYLVDATFDYAVNNPKPDKIIEQWMSDNAIKAMFIAETTGTAPRVPLTDKPISDDVSKHPEVRAFFKSFPDSARNSGPNSEIVSQAMRELGALYKKVAQEVYGEHADIFVERALDESGVMAFGRFDKMMRDQGVIGQKTVDTYALRDRLDKKLKGKEVAFQAWVKDKVMPMFGDPELTLNRKKVPYTLDNIIRKMTAGGTQAKEETLTYGPGKARAAASKKFRNLENMRRAAKDSILSTKSVTEARENADKLLEEYRMAVIEYYTLKNWRGEIDTWNALDDSMKALAAYARSGSRSALKSSLNRNYFEGVPEEVIDLGVKAGRAMLDAPVPYFEAKPRRAVGLSEFAGAVVPKDVDKRVTDILDKNGIQWKKYGNRFDETARTEAINKFRENLAKGNPDVLFSVRKQTESDLGRQGRQYPGVDRATVQERAAKFMTGLGLTRKIKVTVHQTGADLAEALGVDPKEASRALGYIQKDHVHVVADNVYTVEEIDELLRHEILGHYGLSILKPGDKTAILARITESRGLPGIKPIWDEVSKTYGHKYKNRPYKIAEEVFARIAESDPAKRSKIMDVIIDMLISALRKIGLYRDTMTKREARHLLRAMAKGIRIGNPRSSEIRAMVAWHGGPHDQNSTNPFVFNRSVDSSPYENQPDRLITDSHTLADISERSALIEKGFSGLDIPSQRVVLDTVSRMLQDLEIRQLVIESIPVNVVNVLTGGKFSANTLLHDMPMLFNLLSVNGDQLVSLGINGASAAISTIAGSGAKIIRSRLVSRSGKRNSALQTSGRNAFSPALNRAMKGLGVTGSRRGDADSFAATKTSDINHYEPVEFKGIKGDYNTVFDDTDIEITGKFNLKQQTEAENTQAKAKGLPMDKESRLERAREMGFGGDWYHWTDAEFDAFDPDYSPEGFHLGTRSAAQERARGLDTVEYRIEEEDGEGFWVVTESGPKDGEEFGPFDSRGAAKKFSDSLPRKIEPLRLMVKQGRYINLPDLGTWSAHSIMKESGLFSRDEITRAMDSDDPYAAMREGFSEKGVLGVRYVNEVEDRGSESILVFDPANIRSVNAAFDPEYSDSSDLMANLRPDDSPARREALRKAGLLQERRGFASRMKRHVDTLWDAITVQRNEYIDIFRQGALDQFHGIRRATSRNVGNLPADLDPYVTARLATGISSVMRAVLLHGQPQWAKNKQHLEMKDGTRGLLEILQPVAEHIDDWIGWMVGVRAERLLAEGRENNFTQTDIDELKGMAGDRVNEFKAVAREFAEFKRSILDVAEQAGLIDGDARQVWDHSDWIPFYRQIEDNDTLGPTGAGRSLANKTSGIRQLRGGESILNDPMENIVMNFHRLLDASLKNNAVQKAIDYAPDAVEKANYEFATEIVPNSEVKRKLRESGMPEDMVDMLPPSMFKGLGKMWSIKPPSDPDVIRIMENGSPKYYRVTDPLLLRAVTSYQKFDFMGLGAARAFKRLLTSAVTATPEFMLRNFIRDTASTAIVSRDKVAAAGAFKGVMKAYRESGGARHMLFAGASFASGYIDGTDTEATTRAIRRALRSHGMDAASVDSFMGSLLDGAASYWDKYRHISEAIENANREAVFEATLKETGSITAAAFEAKDLMDFSLRGDWVAYQIMGDVLPFFNARVQGMYRLGRSDIKSVAIRGGIMLTIPSILLALSNAGNDDYEQLDDWSKDTYWHFWVLGEHFAIPKPFEVGVLFGTLPERFVRLSAGVDSSGKFAERVAWNVAEQLNLVDIPQIIKPAVEVAINYDTFGARSIENFADEGKSPRLRYNSRTSATARELVGAMGPFADTIGMSPKKLQHLVEGYFGTFGAWGLAVADVGARMLADDPARPTLRPDDVPMLRVLYRGDQQTPYYSTQQVSDVYEAAREYSRILKDYRALILEGKVKDANDVLAKNKERLTVLAPMAGAAKAITALNGQIDRIVMDKKKTPKQKRAEIDKVLASRNLVALNATVQSKKAGSAR